MDRAEFYAAGDDKAMPLVNKPAELASPTSQKQGKFLSLLVVVVWFASGVAAGMYLEGWHFSSALYVVVQTLTTVGYGDIVFVTREMHWFAIVFILSGLAIVANAVNDVCSAALDWQQDQIRTHLRQVQAKFSRKLSRHFTNLDQKQADQQIAKRYGHWNRMVVSLLIFLFFLSSWACFFAWYEPCSCSYGKTLIAGCVEGERCIETGGQHKSWDRAFYMAVVTMTTVGFGDVTPLTPEGRAFAAVWMILGVLSAGNFVTSLTQALAEESTIRQAKDKMDVALFQRLDTDNSGALSKDEFLVYMLLKKGLVSADSIDAIHDTFNAMDSDGDGALTYEEIRQEFSS